MARTPEQRERSIRFWLDLDDDDPLPSATEVERQFVEELDNIGPIFPVTVKDNFRSLVRGGLSTGYQFLACYVDYEVHEYLLGTGPTGSTATLTVAYDHLGEERSYDLYQSATLAWSIP